MKPLYNKENKRERKVGLPPSFPPSVRPSILIRPGTEASGCILLYFSAKKSQSFAVGGEKQH